MRLWKVDGGLRLAALLSLGWCGLSTQVQAGAAGSDPVAAPSSAVVGQSWKGRFSRLGDTPGAWLVVCRDEASWKKVWAWIIRTSGAKPPQVDFARCMAVGVIEYVFYPDWTAVESVAAAGNELRVAVNFVHYIGPPVRARGGFNAYCLQVVEKSDAPVSFVGRRLLSTDGRRPLGGPALAEEPLARVSPGGAERQAVALPEKLQLKSLPARPAAAQAAPPEGFELTAAALEAAYGGPAILVPKVAQGPRLDGELNDPVWEQAPAHALAFLDAHAPGEPWPDVSTWYKVLTDQERLYVAVHCNERAMKKLRIHPGGRDGMNWTDDCVDVYLDVGHREDWTYHQIGVNAAGVINDAADKDDQSWNAPSLEVKTKQAEKFWTVELAVALADVWPDRETLPRLWGANVVRTRWIERDPEGEDDVSPGWSDFDTAWSPAFESDSYMADSWGHWYLQAGRAVPQVLWDKLKQEGKPLEQMGLRAQVAPAVRPPDPAPIPRQAAFTQEPVVEQVGGETKISFAVSAPVDATVWVENEAQAVVRHLASGLLGKKAPPPFRAEGLSQALTWDRKDDRGRAVPPGKYTVRVGLGLKGEFGTIIGGPDYLLESITGLATDAQGQLYVQARGGKDGAGASGSTPYLHVFDRQGKPLRQIMPYPAHLGHEKLGGIGVACLTETEWTPVVYGAYGHCFYPESASEGEGLLFLRSGSLALVTAWRERRLCFLNTDGGAPERYLGPALGLGDGGRVQIAESPDGKYVYATGLAGLYRWDGSHAHHVVYRVLADGSRPAEVFAGAYQAPGRDAGHLQQPSGVAVDAAGNLYVADAGNGRVCAYSAEGTFLGEAALKGPGNLAAHARTGKLYVFTAEGGKALARFPAVQGQTWQPAAPEASLKLPADATGLFCLDASAEPTVLWVAGKSAVHRLEETGAAAEAKGGLPLWDPKPHRVGTWRWIGVDAKSDELYVGNRRYDGKTGQFLGALEGLSALKAPSFGVQPGPDDFLYAHTNYGEMLRFRHDGKPAPFTDPGFAQAWSHFERGFTVAPDGSFYAVEGRTASRKGRGQRNNQVSFVSADGKVKKKGLVQLSSLGSGVGVDAERNIYAGGQVKPARIPEIFQGRIPARQRFYPQSEYWYKLLSASVMKFGPEGGKLIPDPAGAWLVGGASGDGRSLVRARAEGMQWLYFGLSPLSYKGAGSSMGSCTCQPALLAVDGFGRVFAPNLLRFCVEVLDRNGNVLVRLGSYGNLDARGPGSAVPHPEIAFAGPSTVAVSERACYVSDYVNQRITAIRLTYLKEAEKKFGF